MISISMASVSTRRFIALRFTQTLFVLKMLRISVHSGCSDQIAPEFVDGLELVLSLLWHLRSLEQTQLAIVVNQRATLRDCVGLDSHKQTLMSARVLSVTSMQYSWQRPSGGDRSMCKMRMSTVEPRLSMFDTKTYSLP